MTDIKHQLQQLLAGEPDAPDDIERIVSAGRRARRRRQAAMTAAGTVGAAGLTAAVAVPLLASAGNGSTDVRVGVQSSPKPSPTASPAAGHCDFVLGSGNVHQAVQALHKKGEVSGQQWSVRTLKKFHGKKMLEICPKGVPFEDPSKAATQHSQPPAGPPYHYTEDPNTIAARLGSHLQDRVTGFGLDITYTRPFAQESTTMDSGHPSYFDGNVDVHEAQGGYGDIGVQVTHATTEPVPFDGTCNAADNCVETKLPDGSVLRTGQVKAGRGDYLLTAEVHRPDGTVVQAQESNYPFGPDAGTQAHGDQPLTLDQLISLAEDANFAF